MLSGIFNVIYEALTGKSRSVYYSIWYDGKEIGRYMSRHEARRTIWVHELTGALIKTTEKVWWSEVGAMRRHTEHEYIAEYSNGVRS